ncbi:recombinase family protein [Staphylococcus pseudintermedius]|nr:recombinase family protein [Staphylococcus pseudintermedius]MDK3686812.1 recombinase family protein [Staphylococcus pseudintermedius]MDK3846625.1 recombinase family protein [Staphylococcus pseudintermedius]
MKVAIYTRVSTHEQSLHGFSIEEQERKLKQFCEFNDWKVYKIYTDAGYSGAKRDRPALNQLIQDVDKLDLVLVYKLDRLTRSVRDLLDILEILEKNDVSFRSATEVYDTSTAMGRLFVTLVGAMAEWERTTIQERTFMGRRAAAQKGLVKTTPPFYYDRVDDKFVPNEYSKVLRFAVDEIKKGTSLREITIKLNNSNYKAPIGNRWHRSVLRNALKSPVARGHYCFSDVFIENTHEPIITDAEYEEIKERISERTNSVVVRHISAFRGKLVCPTCGNRCTLNTNKHVTQKKGTWYSKHYYCDRCKYDKSVENFSFSEEEALKQFYTYISNFDLTNYEIEMNEEKEPEIEIDIDKINEERKRYHILFAKGLMREDELTPLIKELDDMVAVYNKQKKEDDRKVYDYEQIKDFKYSLLDGWERMDLELKAEFIKRAIKSIKIEYVKGIRGKKPNSINILDVDFY